MKIADFTDDQIVAAVHRGDHCGGFVPHIAFRLARHVDDMALREPSALASLRRRLLKLEVAGRVHRYNLHWPTGYWLPGKDARDRGPFPALATS